MMSTQRWPMMVDHTLQLFFSSLSQRGPQLAPASVISSAAGLSAAIPVLFAGSTVRNSWAFGEAGDDWLYAKAALVGTVAPTRASVQAMPCARNPLIRNMSHPPLLPNRSSQLCGFSEKT